MVIVIDANIFISAFFGGGKPGAILKFVEDKKDTLIITDEIIAELETTFKKRRFKQPKAMKQFALQRVKLIGTKITVPDSERITTGGSRDETDNKYLECAAAADADYIITGDKDLLVLKEYRQTKIVSAAEYLDIVNGAQSRS